MRWTEWEESYLRENAHRGFKAVARELHRSIKSIYGKAARLGIEPTTAPHLSWEEISYVKNNSHKNIVTLMRETGRSKNAILRARRLYKRTNRESRNLQDSP